MLQHLGFFEESVHFRTDNPIEEIWSFILRYSDINYLKKVWKNRQDDEYIYVSICLKQAYEYYLASKGQTLNTKPLLLYYSFLSLSKAILFIINDERPPEYHGLCKEQLNKEIKTINDLLDFSAEINQGVFIKLAEAFDYKVSVGQRLTLGNFLFNTIELSYDLSQYFNKNPGFISPKVSAYINGEIKITFNNILDHKEDSIIDFLTKLLTEFTSESKDSSLIFKSNIGISEIGDKDYDTKATALLKKYFSFSALPDDNYYININEYKMPNLLAYYGIMYILSTIVRYKPDKLYQMINDKC